MNWTTLSRKWDEKKDRANLWLNWCDTEANSKPWVKWSAKTLTALTILALLYLVFSMMMHYAVPHLQPLYTLLKEALYSDSKW